MSCARRTVGFWGSALVLSLMTSAPPGCASARINTTMLDVRDVVAMTDAMLPSLSRDPALVRRSSSSDRWVVTIDRVENLTEHPMSRNERLAIMARLRANLASSDFAQERAITFIVPGKAWRNLEPAQARAHSRLMPTHALRATFLSDTLSTLHQRSDAYLCTFRLSDLATGDIFWEDAFVIKHVIARNELD